MKPKRTLLLAMVMAPILLAACMVTSGFAVRDTVVVQDGSRRLIQSLYSTCTNISGPGSNMSVIVPVGWRHWFARPDGSILILGDQQPCRPAGYPAKQPSTTGYEPIVGPQTAWLFDNAVHPSRADLFETALLHDGARFNVLSVETGPAIHLPSDGLEAAFPWLDAMSSAKPAQPPSLDQISQAGRMTGLIVQAYAIEGAMRCSDQTAPVVGLEEGGACARLRPCLNKADAPCARRLGYLRLTPGTGFQQFVIESATPEPGYIGSLYRTTNPQDEGSAWGIRWSPVICFKGECLKAELGPGAQEYLYLPRFNDVLHVTRASETVGKARFRSQSIPLEKPSPRALDGSRPSPLQAPAL